MKYAAFCILTLLSYVMQTAGAEQVLPPPEPPILARMPGMASWTIDFKYRSDAQPESSTAPTPELKPNPYVFSDEKRSVTVTKSGQIWSEKVLWKSGAHTEMWIFENMRAGIVPGTKKIAVIPFSTEGSETGDYRKMDFEGLEWISQETYRGTVVAMGKPAYFFEEGEPTGSVVKIRELPIGKWGGNRWAVISVETRLPIVSYDSHAERSYRFNPPPTETLVPSKPFLDLFNKLKFGPSGRPRN